MRLQLAVLGLAAIAWFAFGNDARAEQGEPQVTSDMLVYVDSDNVSVVSPQVGVRHPIDEDGGEVSARFVLDAISAASVDVVSNATYRFSEIRTEINLGASKEYRGYLPSLSYRLSNEPDYVSHGATAGVSKDLAGGDATLSAAYSLVLDTVGRTGTPTEVFSESLQSHTGEVSLTQVLDAKTLVRAVYSLTHQRGYMEKPYRSVPIFDASVLQLLDDNGVALGLDNFDTHRLAFKPAEEVPDTRTRHAAALRALRFVDAIDGSLRLDYRLYGDSWGMFGHTVEAALVKSLPWNLRLDSWARLHYQQGADFWQRTYSVDNAMALPSLRTTDKSLSPYLQGTGGIRLERVWGNWKTYFQIAGMYTSFRDHLYIDSRFAIISQGGLRWLF